MNGITPNARYQQDLSHLRPRAALASQLDALFYPRHTRKVRKEGTLTFPSRVFEVPYELTGKTGVLVIDPHTQQPQRCESKTGQDRGAVVPCEPGANTQRRRSRTASTDEYRSASNPAESLVKIDYQQSNPALRIHNKKQEKKS